MKKGSDNIWAIDEAIAKFMLEAGPDRWWERGERKWELVRRALQWAEISKPRGGEWQESSEVSQYYRRNKANIDKILSSFHPPTPSVHEYPESSPFFSCPKCRTSVVRDSTRCSGCGESLSLSPDGTDFVLTHPPCPICGDRVERDYRRCRSCHATLIGPCFHCKHPYSRIENSRCPNCGLDVRRENTLIEKTERDWERSEQERLLRKKEQTLIAEKEFAAAKVEYDKARRNYALAETNWQNASAQLDRIQLESLSGQNQEKLQPAEEELARAKAWLNSAERDLEYWEGYFTGNGGDSDRRDRNSLPDQETRTPDAVIMEKRQTEPLKLSHVAGGVAVGLIWTSLLWMYFFGLGRVGVYMLAAGSALGCIALLLDRSGSPKLR